MKVPQSQSKRASIKDHTSQSPTLQTILNFLFQGHNSWFSGYFPGDVISCHARMSYKGVVTRGENFLLNYPRDKWWWKYVSTATIATIAMTSKLFVHGWHAAEVKGIEHFNMAREQAKRDNRGIVTLMNHVSVLDDPLIWGALPAELWRSNKMRWVLGADNICFKSKALALFFSLGQVLSTRRFGAGPYQPSLDAAICLLNQGQWMHIFPEGFVHQPLPPYEFSLKYFKWGISRMILEPEKPPIVIPMFGWGLQKIFPEDLPPKLLGYGFRKGLRYAIGTPLDERAVRSFRERWRNATNEYDLDGYISEEVQNKTALLRSEVASFSRQGLIDLKKSIGFDNEDPRFGDHSFWEDQQIVKTRNKPTKKV